ncbi:MAG: glycosyltransferase family 2 protein [Patescibacteria group bacterium]
MDLSIIIVNYKSKVKTQRCLEAIFKSDFQDLKYEVIVVDNCSGDNLDDLIGQHAELKLLYSSRNLGMGGGNNLGLKEARGQFILILNPDTVVYPDAIFTLYNYLNTHPDVYIVGPKLLNPDGSLQHSCSKFPKIYTPILRRTFLGDYFKSSRDGFMMVDFNHEEIREVDWLMGSCLFIRRDGWEGFDERFFMYFEDIDVCRRAWRFKKKVVYNPGAIVIHDHARESARNPWYIAPFTDKLTREHIRSWIKYFWKWKAKNK